MSQRRGGDSVRSIDLVVCQGPLDTKRGTKELLDALADQCRKYADQSMKEMIHISTRAFTVEALTIY